MISRALIFSVMAHAFLLSCLLLGSSLKLKPKEISISASLVMKGKKKNKELLPKKAKKKPPKEALKEKQAEKLETNSQDMAKALTAKPLAKKPKQESENYTDTLAALSKSFASELKSLGK